MKRQSVVFCAVFILLMGCANSFEYQININDSLSYSDGKIKLVTLNKDKVILEITGEDKMPPLGIDDPKKIGDYVIIVRNIFYSDNKNESFAMIDLCQKTDETCNNIDDDCDGKIDDGVSRECGDNNTVGICRQGTQKCIYGEWGYCEETVTPQNEICNNLDDNCDGNIDENISRPCGNSPIIGECKNGRQNCDEGKWGKCEGYIFPSVEKCNNMDDDCDGKTDEDIIRDCGESDKGICRLGQEECKGGSWQGCKDAIHPEEEWCDEIDNDCDGAVDNDCKKKSLFSRLKEWFSNLF